jgi:hypothetical protein
MTLYVCPLGQAFAETYRDRVAPKLRDMCRDHGEAITQGRETFERAYSAVAPKLCASARSFYRRTCTGRSMTGSLG